MKIYGEADASLAPLEGQTVAIIGYGNQGRAQALNLRDNGVRVVVGNRDDAYREQAQEDGFEVLPIADAAARGDVLHVLVTDESQPSVWQAEIAPGVASGNLLVWSSGYNVGYGLVVPPEDVDVVMVAPRMIGSEVRNLFERGSGALAAVAVHQDSTGRARERMLAVAKGIGVTRGGVFESTFREEAEMDLFAEQVVWPGIAAWLEQCFELGVEHGGFPPELLVLELYLSGEPREIFDLAAREGFFRQMKHHSTTSQYGVFSRAPRYRSEELLTRGRELLLSDIKGGAFVKEWTQEQAVGATRLAELWERVLRSPLARAEEAVLPVVRGAREGEGDG